MKRLSYLCLVGLLLASAAPGRADIFQWEYINPGDPGQGKQQSTTLAPDGAGVDVVPGADLYFPGDFNNDNTVDAGDYLVWRKGLVGPAAYNVWRTNFGRTLDGGGSSSPAVRAVAA